MTSALLAHDLELTGARGVVYSHVSVAAEPAQTVAIVGPGGSGRTSLLLTLVGRMDPDSGTLVVLGRRVRRGLAGLRDRRHVLRHSTLACMAGVTDLDESLTVGEVVGERAALLSGFAERVGGIDDEFVASVWGFGRPAAGLEDTDLEDMDTADYRTGDFDTPDSADADSADADSADADSGDADSADAVSANEDSAGEDSDDLDSDVEGTHDEDAGRTGADSEFLNDRGSAIAWDDIERSAPPWGRHRAPGR